MIAEDSRILTTTGDMRASEVRPGDSLFGRYRVDRVSHVTASHRIVLSITSGPTVVLAPITRLVTSSGTMRADRVSVGDAIRLISTWGRVSRVYIETVETEMVDIGVDGSYYANGITVLPP